MFVGFEISIPDFFSEYSLSNFQCLHLSISIE